MQEFIFNEIKNRLLSNLKWLTDVRIYQQQDLLRSESKPFKTPIAFIQFETVGRTTISEKVQKVDLNVIVKFLNEDYSDNFSDSFRRKEIIIKSVNFWSTWGSNLEAIDEYADSDTNKLFLQDIIFSTTYTDTGVWDENYTVVYNGTDSTVFNIELYTDFNSYVINPEGEVVDPSEDYNISRLATKNYVNNAIDTAISTIPAPDLSSYATTDYVDTTVSNIDLSNYATTAYVDSAVSNVSVDLTGYATESYVDTAISNIDIPEGGGSGSALSGVGEKYFFGVGAGNSTVSPFSTYNTEIRTNGSFSIATNNNFSKIGSYVQCSTANSYLVTENGIPRQSDFNAYFLIQCAVGQPSGVLNFGLAETKGLTVNDKPTVGFYFKVVYPSTWGMPKLYFVEAFGSLTVEHLLGTIGSIWGRYLEATIERTGSQVKAIIQLNEDDSVYLEFELTTNPYISNVSDLLGLYYYQTNATPAYGPLEGFAQMHVSEK